MALPRDAEYVAEQFRREGNEAWTVDDMVYVRMRGPLFMAIDIPHGVTVTGVPRGH